MILLLHSFHIPHADLKIIFVLLDIETLRAYSDILFLDNCFGSISFVSVKFIELAGSLNIKPHKNMINSNKDNQRTN